MLPNLTSLATTLTLFIFNFLIFHIEWLSELQSTTCDLSEFFADFTDVWANLLVETLHMGTQYSRYTKEVQRTRVLFENAQNRTRCLIGNENDFPVYLFTDYFPLWEYNF